MSGHKPTKSNEAMRLLSDNQLAEIIKSGSLRHAAARYELQMRGRTTLLLSAINYWPPR